MPGRRSPCPRRRREGTGPRGAARRTPAGVRGTDSTMVSARQPTVVDCGARPPCSGDRRGASPGARQRRHGLAKNIVPSGRTHRHAVAANCVTWTSATSKLTFSTLARDARPHAHQRSSAPRRRRHERVLRGQPARQAGGSSRRARGRCQHSVTPLGTGGPRALRRVRPRARSTTAWKSCRCRAEARSGPRSPQVPRDLGLGHSTRGYGPFPGDTSRPRGRALATPSSTAPHPPPAGSTARPAPPPRSASPRTAAPAAASPSSPRTPAAAAPAPG